mgnify:CR=1 FL=1
MTNSNHMRLNVFYGPGNTQAKSISVELGEVGLVIAAKRLAGLLLSEHPPLVWSALLAGQDVTPQFAHVMRAVVYGNEGPEAAFFLGQVGL